MYVKNIKLTLQCDNKLYVTKTENVVAMQIMGKVVCDLHVHHWQ